MKVTILLESDNSFKTFHSDKILFLSDWLSAVNEATQSEFKGIESIAAEHTDGSISWSDPDEKELPLW